MFCPKPLPLRFLFRNAYSTLPHSRFPNPFSHFASTRFNMSEADINRMIKIYPTLQRLQTLHKVEEFVDLLNRYGCSDLQIAKIMMMQPRIITTDAEKILEPKIKLLEDFGFKGKSMSKLLSINPTILTLSLENVLLPKMELLKKLFQSQKFLMKSLDRFPTSLNSNLKSSVDFWERWGFQGAELFRFIRIHPRVLQLTSLTPAQVDLIQEIGADKESNAYKYIVSLVATSRVETLRDKIQNLRRCGLSAEETLQLCRAKYQALWYSKVRVNETMKFVIEDMGFPPNYIVKHNSLLDISLEKIMRPRFLVWKKIECMNGSSLPLLSILKMSEARFVRNIIRRHPESTALWAIYEDRESQTLRTLG